MREKIIYISCVCAFDRKCVMFVYISAIRRSLNFSHEYIKHPF